ncbi:MAG: FG-GAP-like repeat-containing protein [bacterium]
MKIQHFGIYALFLLFLNTSYSQNINTTANFPDANFRLAVEAFMGVAHEGEFTAAEAAAKEGTLNCSSQSIADMTGLAYFTGITGLNCNSNLLTQLNVSANTALIDLFCSGNDLTQLDLSANTALVGLYCSLNNLTQLDLSANTALQTIECYVNGLTQLNVTTCTALQTLACAYNSLVQLDVSNNVALNHLDCSFNNLVDISSLVTNTGLSAGDKVDIRNNPLIEDDYNNMIILRKRIGDPVFDAGNLLSGFAYSPQDGGAITLPTLQCVDDFNNDDKPDFFWRNYSTGMNAGWLMNNCAFLSSLSFHKVTEDMNWVYSGMGDFNGDGKPDLVWRHYVNGKNAIWYMDGDLCTGTAYMPPATDTQWVLSGVEDMNQDSHPDLIWRHSGNGKNAIWYMNGPDCTGVAYFQICGELNWRIAGVRDFNGNGTPDLLWRNYSTGQNAIWYMNNAAYTGSSWLMPVTDTNWIIASVNDHDDNGTCDIVWRNYSTGRNRVWYMNNATYLGYGDPMPDADVNWRMGTSYIP